MDLAGSQVPHFAGAEPADAGVADAHPAAVGKLRPGLLAGDEDRRSPVAGRLEAALGEADRPAFSRHRGAADDGLEALHLEQLRVALLLPVLDQGVEHLPGPRD